MSKRPINALIKDVVNENENDSDDEYNKCLRKVCRISYIENCQNAVSSKADALLCKTSRFRFDCNASTSNVVQCSIKDVNDNAVQHVTSVEKVVHVSDQKGKKVVNLLNNIDNTFEKTFEVGNQNLMNKGHAFFERSRIGTFSILHKKKFLFYKFGF